MLPIVIYSHTERSSVIRIHRSISGTLARLWSKTIEEDIVIVSVAMILLALDNCEKSGDRP